MAFRGLRNAHLRGISVFKHSGLFKFTLLVLLLVIIFLQLNQSRRETNAIVNVKVVKARNSTHNNNDNSYNDKDETTTMEMTFPSVPSVLLDGGPGDASDVDDDNDDEHAGNVKVIHLNTGNALNEDDRNSDTKPVSSVDYLRQYFGPASNVNDRTSGVKSVSNVEGYAFHKEHGYNVEDERQNPIEPGNKNGESSKGDALKFITNSEPDNHGTYLSNIRYQWENKVIQTGPKRGAQLSNKDMGMLGAPVTMKSHKWGKGEASSDQRHQQKQQKKQTKHHHSGQQEHGHSEKHHYQEEEEEEEEEEQVQQQQQQEDKHQVEQQQQEEGENVEGEDEEQQPEEHQSGEQWTDIQIHKRRFRSSENKQIFILGAVAKNSTPTSGWDAVSIYGQWYHQRVIYTTKLRCCFMDHAGAISEGRVIDYNIKNYVRRIQQAKLLLWHLTCDTPSFQLRGVSVTRDADCQNKLIRFVRPLYATKLPDDHLVITTKLAYGHINEEMVITFLETVRYLGVDKVITYVYRTLDPEIRRILRYYSSIGLLEYNTIEFPEVTLVPRKMPPHAGPQYMSDEWLLKRDALERSMGSTYFGIFDMDEFLVPSNNRNFKELLRDLRAEFHDASHFYFTNIHYLTDMKDPSCEDCSFFKRYTRISPLRFNRIHEKMILMTSRVESDTIQNHNVAPLAGFELGHCPSTEAYVRHYGRCVRKFTRRLCVNKRIWMEDTSMVIWSENTVQANIDHAIDVLGV